MIEDNASSIPMDENEGALVPFEGDIVVDQISTQQLISIEEQAYVDSPSSAYSQPEPLIPSVQGSQLHNGGPRRCRGRLQTKCNGTIVRGLIMMVLTSSLTEYIDFLRYQRTGNFPSSSPSLPPKPETRSDLIFACAAKLSGGYTSLVNGASFPRFKAIEWYLYGSGMQIAPPSTLSECSVGSLFATLYGLVVVRGALEVTTPSWNDPKSMVLELSDVCRWHHIDCNSARTKITKLNFGSAYINGTIPRELSLLNDLQSIQLYKNHGLHGYLPPELSSMTSLAFLYLHDTNLKGNIPTSFATLHRLQELYVDRTMLEGTMPEGICRLRSHGFLSSLHADCGGIQPRIICDNPSCCTVCHESK